MLWKASLSAHVLWRRWAWLCLAAISVEGDKCPQCCPDSAFLQGEPFFLNTIAYNSNKIGIAACLSPPTFIFVCLHSRSFEAKPYRRRWFQRLTIGSFPKCPKVFLKVGMLNKWCKYSSSLWQPYSCCPSSSFFFFFFKANFFHQSLIIHSPPHLKGHSGCPFGLLNPEAALVVRSHVI